MRVRERYTIYELIEKVNKQELVCSPFKEGFTWGLQEIENLWDSLFDGYGINTFSFWDVADMSLEVRQSYYFSGVLVDGVFGEFNNIVPYNISRGKEQTKQVVIDGNLRLNALYLVLQGYLMQKTDETVPSMQPMVVSLTRKNMQDTGKSFEVKFSERQEIVSSNYFELKRILDYKGKTKKEFEEIIEKGILRRISMKERDYAKEVLLRLYYLVYEMPLNVVVHKLNNLQKFIKEYRRYNRSVKEYDLVVGYLKKYWGNIDSYLGNTRKDIKWLQNIDKYFVLNTWLQCKGYEKDYLFEKGVIKELKQEKEKYRKVLLELGVTLKQVRMDIPYIFKHTSLLEVLTVVIYHNIDNWKKEKERFISSLEVFIFRYIYENVLNTYPSYFLKTNLFQAYRQEYIIDCLKQVNFSLESDLFKKHWGIEEELKVKLLDELRGMILSVKEREEIEFLIYLLTKEHRELGKNYLCVQVHPEENYQRGKLVGIDESVWMYYFERKTELINLGVYEETYDNLFVYYNNLESEEEQNRFKKLMLIPNDFYEFESMENFYESRLELLVEKCLKQLGIEL